MIAVSAHVSPCDGAFFGKYDIETVDHYLRYSSGIWPPRRVDALVGIRAHSASAGSDHSLVVTEEGALHSFGGGDHGVLGHGNSDEELSPRMVGAVRNVRIAAAAAGD